MEGPRTISVLVEQTQEADGTKGVFLDEAQIVRVSLPIERLRDELQAEIGKLVEILGSAPVAKTGWNVGEVEVGIEISAEGGVSFIGTAKAGARASFKLRFKRM